MRYFIIKSILLILVLTSEIVYGWSFGDVVMNEFMWMGTSRSIYDEYLELRNNTGTPINFSTTNWSIYRNDELLLVINHGILPANGYFLISRMDTASSALGIMPDMVTTALFLNNSDVQYKLYAGPDNTYTLLDVADDESGVPLAGNYHGFMGGIYWSMERNDIPGDGTLESSWHTACLSINFDVGATERGTPKAPNRKNSLPFWSGVVAPSFATDSDDLIFTALACQDTDNIPDSMEVIGIWWKIGDPMPIYSATNYGVAAGTDVDVILPHSFTEPGMYYMWKISLDDGQDTVARAGTLFVHFNPRDITIDELCWGGSSRNSQDEWFEILNNRDDTVYFGQTPIYLWRKSLAGENILFYTLNSGSLAPNSRFLIKRLPAGDENTAVAVSPDIVIPDFTMYDGKVFLGFSDLPDTDYFIDVCGDGSSPFAGAKSTADSLWASMFRVSPESDGSLPSSWKTSAVSINYYDSLLDRGTPGAPSVPNHPPRLSLPDTLSFFEPDTGTKDTIFTFYIMYSDSDGTSPDSAILLADLNNDGRWQPDEVIPMSVVSSSPDFVDGVILSASVSGFTPTMDGEKFTFRVSDGLVITPFPIPAENGPIIYPVAGIWLSDTVWRTDTLHWFTDKFAMSPPIEVRNTGDLPEIVELRILSEDTFEHDCCFPHCEGGWISTCDVSELDCNTYMLSAIFLSDSSTPDTSYFDEFGDDDCLTPLNFRVARGDTFGVFGTNAAENLLQDDSAFLRFLIRLPHISYGIHTDEAHKITVEMKCVVDFP